MMSTPSKTSKGGFNLEDAVPVADREDEGLEVHIIDLQTQEVMFFQDPDGNDLVVSITVAGTYSHKYRRATEAQTTKTLKRRTARLTGEILGKQRIELLATCVLSWQGFYEKGKILACSRDNVMQVFLKAPWIREQVESAMEDHEGFLKGNSSD